MSMRFASCDRALRMPVLVAVLLLAACASAPRAPHQAGDATAPGAGQSLVPDPAQAQFQRAVDLMRARSYGPAEALLQGLARDYPGLAGPYLNLGIIYRETGRRDQAEQAFRQALERNPGNAAAYTYLGLLYREAGRFADARAAYEQALAADSGYAYAHLDLGILLDLYLQQPDQALAHYQTYQRLAGDDKQVAAWIADLERRLQTAPAAVPVQAPAAAPAAAPGGT